MITIKEATQATTVALKQLGYVSKGSSGTEFFSKEVVLGRGRYGLYIVDVDFTFYSYTLKSTFTFAFKVDATDFDEKSWELAMLNYSASSFELGIMNKIYSLLSRRYETSLIPGRPAHYHRYRYDIGAVRVVKDKREKDHESWVIELAEKDVGSLLKIIVKQLKDIDPDFKSKSITYGSKTASTSRPLAYSKKLRR